MNVELSDLSIEYKIDALCKNGNSSRFKQTPESEKSIISKRFRLDG